MEKIALTPKDFEKLFNDKLSDFVKKKIESYKLAYSPVTEAEKEQVLIKIIDTLIAPYIVYSGPHRLKHWENGWKENFEELLASKKEDALRPRYLGKYEINRLDQKFVKAGSPEYERNMLSVIVYYLFDKYLREAENIYEFGCGTGHDLLKAREINPAANLIGLDWTRSSQKILKRMSDEKIVENITGINFDYFRPDNKIKIAKNSAIYTVASLEQVGTDYKKFVSYLLKNKPDICVHIEPIAELLDETKLLDNLAIKYFNKRHYLNGFLTYLRRLEKDGKIKIHEAKRNYIGSFFHEGLSIVVWSPVK